jgi:hypothetical protein
MRPFDAAIAAFNRMPWLWRRIAVFCILFWSMGLITYLAIAGDEETRRDVAFYVSGCLMATMSSYLGISAWDHHNERKANLAAAALSPASDTVEVKT